MGRNTPAVRHVLTGSLLLALGVLTMLAPPVEGHDMRQNDHSVSSGVTHRVYHGDGQVHKIPNSRSHTINNVKFFGGDLTAIHPNHFEIQWIRIYKNPKITKLADFSDAEKLGKFAGYEVIAPTDFAARRAPLFPSIWGDPASEAFWVNINPGADPSDDKSGGLLDDPEKPGNSGLVTATDNTTVVPGDIVAIAINVKLAYYSGERELDPTPQDSDRIRQGNLTNEVPAHIPADKKVWLRNYNYSRRDRLAGGKILAAVHIKGVGVLNPNYPLARFPTLGWHQAARPVTHADWGHSGKDGYHTLVYQFEVKPKHFEALNGLLEELGRWFDGPSDNVNVVNPFNVPWRSHAAWVYAFADPETDYLSYDDIKREHVAEFGFFVPFGRSNDTTSNRWRDFLDPTSFLNLAEYKDKYDDEGTTREVTYPKTDFNRNGNSLLDYLPGVAYPQVPAPTAMNPSNTRDWRSGDDVVVPPEEHEASASLYDESDTTIDVKWPHRFPPMYDTSGTNKAIFYPRVEVTYQPVKPEIVGVPAETQTGDPFQVTLRFRRSDKNLVLRAVNLDYSAALEDALTTLPSALSAAVEHGTVTRVEELRFSRDDITLRDAAGTETPVEEPQVAQFDELLVQLEETRGTAQKSKWFQVTVEPTVLGFVGDMTLRVPADVLEETKSGGNLASAAVTVPLDIPLPPVEAQSEVVAPESGVYLAGDEITVEVSFATDELTFEGENPPYVIIYLGSQEPANARHAVWQKGSERSGSTIVPFVYTVHTADPIVSSVSVDLDSSDSLNSLLVPRETTLMAASGLNRPGTADPAAAAGEAAPVSDAPVPGPSSDRPTFEVKVEPKEPQVIYILPEESDPKAAATVVPRSPIVFNELGNGSGDANDWLELRNVSGSDVSLKDWELSVVADGKKEDTSLIVFPDVSVPANGLLLITNMPADKTPLAGGANKGLSHALLVNDGLSLPDDGKFLLILRNAKEKLGLNEAFIDVAGGGGSDTDAFVREQTGLYDTHVWPLQVREAPGGDTEDALSAGKVWARAHEKIVGYHKDAWAEAAFTGLGYDRKVSDSPEHAGTPGYPNGAVKTEASTPQGAVTFSEIMFDTAGATLPQWIELYNNSKTEALNLNRWKLEIQNRNSEDLVGRPIVTLTLQEKVIQPNQTLLIVAGDVRASLKSENVFPADRVYNLLKLHEKNLRIKKPQDAFLSAEGFYLKLSDSNGTKIDEIGNLDDNRRTDGAPLWVMPVSGMEDARSSLVRRYTKGVAENGMERAGWAVAAHFKQFKVADLHYGHADDIGTPGYRKGGALPVELSSFTVSRTEAGAVIVTWTTESEVDNAGFNLRRSLERDSGFTLLNPTLIAGAGTTGEQQTYTFTDTAAKPGVEYYYQIEEVSFGGKREMLVTRRLAGPVSPANRALTTFGEVKKAK